MGATAALFAAVAAAAAIAAEPPDPDRYVGWPLLLRLEVESFYSSHSIPSLI